MNNILIFVLVYLGYVFIWFVINLVGYFLSIITKKRITDVLVGIASVVATIINIILGLGLLAYIGSLLFSGQFLLFLLFIFIGYYVVTTIFGVLQLPLLFIPGYFSEKLSQTDLNEDIMTAEILDKDDNVIGISEGDVTIKRRMAKYFLFLYLSLLSYMLIFPAEREGRLFGDFIVNPFLQLITVTVIFGIIYSVYHKFKFGRFFPEDKRKFFIQTWKIGFYFSLFFGIILFLVAIATNTY